MTTKRQVAISIATIALVARGAVPLLTMRDDDYVPIWIISRRVALSGGDMVARAIDTKWSINGGKQCLLCAQHRAVQRAGECRAVLAK